MMPARPDDRRADPRVLLFTDDDAAPGSTGRGLRLARALRERLPEARVLVIAGTSGIEGQAVPDGVDYVVLPSPVGEHLGRARRRVLVQTLLGFAPGVVVMDGGSGREPELAPALDSLRGRCPELRVVNGASVALLQTGRGGPATSTGSLPA